MGSGVREDFVVKQLLQVHGRVDPVRGCQVVRGFQGWVNWVGLGGLGLDKVPGQEVLDVVCVNWGSAFGF